MKKIFLIGFLFLAGCVTENTGPTNVCERQISEDQIRNEVVSSLTSLEVKLNEVKSLKLIDSDVRLEGVRKLVVLKYNLALNEPSKLSRAIKISDPARKTMEVVINANLSCLENTIGATAIYVDGQLYNDVSDDDRPDANLFNEENKNSLKIDKSN